MAKVPKQLTPFKKGQSGNPKGRPVGSRSFKTLVNEAIIKIATDTGQDPLELERDIVVKGLLSARKGDYRFYKDTMDRVHGQAKQINESVITLNLDEETKQKANEAIKGIL